LPELLRGRGTASTLSISSISGPRYLPNALANVRILSKAGGVVAFGTDVPMLAVRDAVDLELELLLKAGLTPAEIIRAATVNAATYLGMADTIGTIQAGKIADLVIVGGDPLNDIASLRDIRLVVRDGEVVFSSATSPF
jgi:imidazolonepropionase-like amidohydrolase